MSANIKVSGSWQELVSLWVKVSGSWQELDSAWVKVSGTWQQVYSNVVLTLSGGGNSATANDPVNASCGFKIDANGNMYERDNGAAYGQISSGTDWIRPTTDAPGTYECRWTNRVDTTGSPTVTVATVAEDVWHPLSSGDFQLDVADMSTPGLPGVRMDFDLEIREGSSGPALVSAAYYLAPTTHTDD